MNRKYGCAVLAGGAGKRMGQLNKAELRYNGGSFLTNTCNVFEKAGMRGYISAANYEQIIPAGWTIIRDSVTDNGGEFVGPIGGVYSCLQQAEEDGLEGLFFAPCDAPLFSRRIIDILSNAIDANEECDAAVVRTGDGRIQTTFGWYSVRCLPQLEADIKQGKYKLARSIEDLRTIFISTDEAGLDDKRFMNINHLDEYRVLQNLEAGEAYNAE